MDFDITPYNFGFAAQSWTMLTALLVVAALFMSFILAVARNGMAAGLRLYVDGVKGYASDLASISPQRVLALTRLTLLEAIRRRALYVFVMFAVLLMFAGWFITDSNGRAELQVSVHVTFLLTAISWLILPAVIFLSCWALPEDIRIRSLHTVVTKPARRLEIVMGRMAGLGLVTLAGLLVMGAIGLFWLNRRIPENAQAALQCRVPEFGGLYFIGADGVPGVTGLNVGDVWAYRSHIEGNSRARAVWLFPGVDESALSTAEDGSQELLLECRFEAFRTVKGSEASIRQGISAQYTLTVNPREDAFGMLAVSESLRPVSEALREGQYRNAAGLTTELAERIRTASDELRSGDYFALYNGMGSAGGFLETLGSELTGDMPARFQAASAASQQVLEALRAEENGASIEVPFGPLADSLDSVAEGLNTNAEGLTAALPRLEVPLPSFHVAEYHDNEENSTNLTRVPRTLRFVADYETLARFLAEILEEWNGSGKLVSGGNLSATLTNDLVSEVRISQLNAERLVQVLEEQLAAGALTADGGNSLSIADDRNWYAFLDELIRREQLVSEDANGWVIEKDLLNDLLDSNGQLRVEVACINDQMYLGMARPDLFIRKADQPFWKGYWKAIVNIGLMLLLVIVLGVTVSCIVKGPVALFFTLTFFLVGQFFHDFMQRKLAGVEEGMGTVESVILIAQHRNPQVGMDVSEATMNVVSAADGALESVLWVFNAIVPDFTIFNRASAFVENRFDVPFNDVVIPAIVSFFGFLIPCILIAGALLKFRELEAK